MYNFNDNPDIIKENANNPDFVAIFGAPNEAGKVAVKSGLEITAVNRLGMLAEARGLPLPENEYRFHPQRRWRFDLCYPEQKIAIEIEGGTRGNGRHNRHEGYTNDCRKYNAATALGWRVLRFTSDMVHDGTLEIDVAKALLNEQ